MHGAIAVELKKISLPSSIVAHCLSNITIHDFGTIQMILHKTAIFISASIALRLFLEVHRSHYKVRFVHLLLLAALEDAILTGELARA